MKKILPLALTLCIAVPAQAAVGWIGGSDKLVTYKFTPVDNFNRHDPNFNRIINSPDENTVLPGTIMLGELIVSTPEGNAINLTCTGMLTSATTGENYLVKDESRSNANLSFEQRQTFYFYWGASEINHTEDLPVGSYFYNFSCIAADHENPNTYQTFAPITNYRINKTR